jgi:hypothetical protein
MAKEKSANDKQRSTKHTYNAKDRVIRTPQSSTSIGYEILSKNNKCYRRTNPELTFQRHLQHCAHKKYDEDKQKHNTEN